MTSRSLAVSFLHGVLCGHLFAISAGAQVRLESSDSAVAEQCRITVQREGRGSGERTQQLRALTRCNVTGPSLLVQRWAAPSNEFGELSALLAASYYLPDVRVLRRLNEVVQDTSQPLVVRQGALVTILGILEPVHVPSVRRDDRTGALYASFVATDHEAPTPMAQAIPSAEREESARIAARIAKVDSNPLLRYQANAVASLLRSQRESKR